MALKDFLAVIQTTDVQRSNRYVVEVQPPNIPGLGIKPQQQINLMCQSVDFPGQNMRTATDDLRQGPTRDIAQAVTYGNMNMTFICTPGLPEKLFFEAWQKLMFNATTWQARFYNDYIGQIKLRSLDRTDMVRYGIILYEAFPKIINAQTYDNTSSDAIQTLQVEFAFHHWKMDEEVYDGTKRYGSEGGADQDKKPKRTVLAGTEDMSAAEAMAFIRGETKNTLGQTYSEAITAAGGGTGAGQVAANMLSGAGKNIGFAGFETAWAQMPAVSKTKTGTVVVADEAPNNDSILMSAMTPGIFGASWPSSNTGATKQTAEEPVSTLFCRPQRKQSTAVKSLPLNGNKPGATVAAPTSPEQQRAGAWVNPNTGQTVGGATRATGKVNVGATLTNMRSTLSTFFPGSYSGSLASTSSGVLKQAATAPNRSVEMKAGSTGITIKASISLGGGRGGGFSGGGGLSSLLSIPKARGLVSGIGIPRFGGISAVRGAGFQVQAIGSKPRAGARGGRANHNAEGGESGDGRDDR